MLRIALTAEDLDLVQVATRPAPLIELRTLFREPLAQRLALERGDDQAKVDLVLSLVAHPCAPGFLFHTAADPDEAIDMVVGARRDAVRRDLDDNASAGFPLPVWTAELAQPGYAGTRARNALHAALTHVVSRYIQPRSHRFAPAVTARMRARRDAATAHGAQAMLNSLHPGIRFRAGALEVELASGADVEATATGAGVRVVPTLLSSPGATLSSDGHAPLVLAAPVPVPADRIPETRSLADPALEQLIGPTRSMLLGVVATHPGRGTRELARLSGLAPASVTDHTQALRAAGLTEATRHGARVAHRLTSLGWALLIR